MSVGCVHSKPGSPCPLMPTAAKRATVSRPRFSLRVCFHYAYAAWFALMNCYPLALLALPLGPFSFSPDCLQSNQLLLLLVAGCGLLLLVPTWRHRLRQTPTATTCPDVHRHALSIRSPLLCLFNSPFSLHFSSFLSLPPPSLPFSLSPSLFLSCVSHHHHHRRSSWNRSHSQSRSRRIALPSFNTPPPRPILPPPPACSLHPLPLFLCLL